MTANKKAAKSNTLINPSKIRTLLQILLGLNLIYVISKIFTSDLYIFDDMEHLRAAYFITLGDMPYRDFFEHHHPLFWYLFAPIISVIPKHIIPALYIGRIICFAISLVTGYYIYKIEKKFIGGKICALICLNIYFWILDDTAVRGMFQIKPDTGMHCCFFIGLYYLFNYFRYKKFKHLQIAALALTFSFLFLQTAIFPCALLMVPLAYFFYRHPQKRPDVLKAALLPLTILGLCAYILWQSDCLKIYYELNWQLNSIFAKIWSNIFTYHFIYFPVLLGVTFASVLWHVKNQKKNFYWLILFFCCIGELIRCCMMARFGQHYLLLMIYAAMIAAPYICKKEKLLTASLYITIFYTLLGLSTLSKPLHQKQLYQLLEKEEYGTTITAGVFGKRPSYYWSHVPAETVHDIYFHRVPDYDINQLNEQYPLQFVFYFPALSPFEHKTLSEALTPKQQEIYKKHYISLETLKSYKQIGTSAYLKAH